MFGRLQQGSLFQRGLRLGNLIQSGQNYQAVLDGRHWDNTISSFGVKETGTERSLDTWAIWERYSKGDSFTGHAHSLDIFEMFCLRCDDCLIAKAATAAGQPLSMSRGRLQLLEGLAGYRLVHGFVVVSARHLR